LSKSRFWEFITSRRLRLIRNVFWISTLRWVGLRLVNRTVNFDDPGTYHLYIGEDAGSPGTILTFFPWPNAVRGTPGVGQVTVTSFSVPERSLAHWEERLSSAHVPLEVVDIL